MKNLLLLFVFFPLISFSQNVDIPDANFKAYLVENREINTNGDNEIQLSEASVFKGTIDCSSKKIINLKGIEAFTALTSLHCEFNNQLTAIDVSKNTALTSLWCGYPLTSLDVSNNTALTTLFCSDTQLTSLDVSNNTALTTLICSGNQLTTLDVSNNTALTTLRCRGNQFNCRKLKKPSGLKQ